MGHNPSSEEIQLKRIALAAVAALLVAGTQLHAQGQSEAGSHRSKEPAAAATVLREARGQGGGRGQACQDAPTPRAEKKPAGERQDGRRRTADKADHGRRTATAKKGFVTERRSKAVRRRRIRPTKKPYSTSGRSGGFRSSRSIAPRARGQARGTGAPVVQVPSAVRAVHRIGFGARSASGQPRGLRDSARTAASSSSSESPSRRPLGSAPHRENRRLV